MYIAVTFAYSYEAHSRTVPTTTVLKQVSIFRLFYLIIVYVSM